MRWSPLVATVVLASLLSGCLAGLEVPTTNKVDCLLYAGQFTDKSVTKTFRWTTTGTVAAVNWGTANVEDGSVRVVVTDAAGKVVYDGRLAKGGPTAAIAEDVQGTGVSQYTKSGATGEWKVAITFSDFTGAMGLSVQTRGTDYETVCNG